MHMKKLSFILLALLSLSAVSCRWELDPILAEDGIVFHLSIDEPVTKATKEGVGSYNENKFGNTLDVFFFNQTTGVITKYFTNVRLTGSQAQIPTNPNDIEEIFGTLAANATRGVFVVTNFAGTYAGTDSLAQVKRSLLQPVNWDPSSTFQAQSSFVMTGEKTVKLLNAKAQVPVNESIEMSRVAAKVTFEVSVANTTADGTENWIPDSTNMEVYMVYAMRKAVLGATPQPMPATETAEYTASERTVYKQYGARRLVKTSRKAKRLRGADSVMVSLYATSATEPETPFYAYPCVWEPGSAMEPYMKLIIPWTHGSVTKRYYYKIPMPGTTILRNHWYKISIDVQILGTEVADPPQVEVTYCVANWAGEIDTSTAQGPGTSTVLPATIIAARFLNVPTTEYVLYNTESLVIPISSSSDVEVVGFTAEADAYKPTHWIDDNYVGNNPRIYNPFTGTVNNNIIALHPNYSSATTTATSASFPYNQEPSSDPTHWSVKVYGRDSVKFVHALNRDMSSTSYDVAPYSIKIRIRHKAEPDKYYEDVLIEQRPPIIIKPERNSDDGAILERQTETSGSWWNQTVTLVVGSNHTQEDGYVFFNGSRTAKNSDRPSSNFNMYVIETSVLPTSGELSTYVLGDPRDTVSVSSLTGGTAASGVNIAGGANRSMANYYPAMRSEDYKIFVAPKFRIASSFGTTTAKSRDASIFHCATYQEDGYPAGRWRLPTYAEIYYMISLSQKGKIPELFTPDTDVANGGYWCAFGAIFPLNNNGVRTAPFKTDSEANDLHNGTHWPRCVYDEWFWEDTVHEKAADKTLFTWGDEARSTVRKK